MQYISLQHQKAKRGTQSSGANFAYRAKTYAAVGGYNSGSELAEDVELGRKITFARLNAKTHTGIAYAGARVSRLYTSSRRSEKALREGLSPIEQWEKGFSAFDDAVRKVQWEHIGKAPDLDNPAVVKKLVSELENIINRTLVVTAHWWARAPYDTYQRRALGWLGIKYKLVDRTHIQITDASALVENLKEYQKDGLRIMERKTAKKPGKVATPQPEASETREGLQLVPNEVEADFIPRSERQELEDTPKKRTSKKLIRSPRKALKPKRARAQKASSRPKGKRKKRT